MKAKITMKQILAVAVLLNLLVMLQSIPVTANPVSPTIYLDDLPSSATYTLKTDGTNYWAVRYDGYKAYEGTSFGSVFNQTIEAMGDPAQGLVHLGIGTFPAAGYEFTFKGIGGSSLPTRLLIIEGEGQGTVITQTSTGKRIFIYQDGMNFELRNLKLSMRSANDANSESALVFSSAGSNKRAVYGGIINNVWVTGGDNTHPLVYMENFFHVSVPWMLVYADYGNAIKMYNDDASNDYGNSNFGHIRARAGSSGTCIEVTGSSSLSRYMNLLSFDHLELGGGLLGFYVHGRSRMIRVNFLNVEGLSNGGTLLKVYSDGKSGSEVYVDTLTGGIPTNGFFVDFNNTSNNRIESGNMWDEGTPNTIIRDRNNAYFNGPNVISLSVVNLTDATRYTITSTVKPHLALSSHDGSYNPLWTPQYGSTGSVTNGTWIPISTGMLPTSYWATGTKPGTIVNVIAVNSTHMQIATETDAGGVGDSQTINWFAAWYP